MAKKRLVRLKPKAGEEQSSPVSSEGAEKKGGIKRRTNLPVVEIAPKQYNLPGELGVLVNSMNANAGPAAPFVLASVPRYNAGYCKTGVLALDLALGGGWRLSRGSMIYGERSAGKSTIALLTAAEMQRIQPDKYVGYVDIEGTLDLEWAKKLGVDLERLIIAEPDTGEDAVNEADGLVRTREIAMVITDSIAMLSPSKEIDEAAEQEFMGLQARLVGKFLRKTNNALIRERKRDHNPLILHLNQFRMKIGLVFGDPRTLPGGKALEFATTQQVEIKNKEAKETKGDDKGLVTYNEHNFNITKNKSGGPLREGMFKFIRVPHDGMPETWIDQAATIRELGLKAGVLSGSPTSFSHDGLSRKWRGAPDYNAWAIENAADHRRVMSDIIEYYRRKWKLT